MNTKLQDRIASRQVRAGVVGLGYVGLPLAVEFARAGYTVTGIDLSQPKVDAINEGRSYIPDVKTSDVAECVNRRRAGCVMSCNCTSANSATPWSWPVPPWRG